MSNPEKNNKHSANESILATSFKEYPKTLKKLLPWLINFIFVVIAVLALSFLTPFSLFFTIPLAVIPFFFALQVSDSYIHLKDDLDNKRFAAYLKSYFLPVNFGCFRIVRSALFSLLISFGVAFLFGFAYVEISLLNGMDLNAILNTFLEAYQAGDIEGMNAILNSEPMLSLMTWTGVVESVSFALSFLFHIYRYGVLAYFHFSIQGVDARTVNAFYKAALRSTRTKGYNKDYFSVIWPMLLLSVLSLGLGIYFGYLLTTIESVSLFFQNNSYFQNNQLISLTAVLTMLLFVALFLPYYFDSMILLYQKYELSFGQAALEFAQETINQLKQTEQLSKEEREEIEKNLSSLKKQQEDLDNKEKEEKKQDDSSDDENRQ